MINPNRRAPCDCVSADQWIPLCQIDWRGNTLVRVGEPHLSRIFYFLLLDFYCTFKFLKFFF